MKKEYATYYDYFIAVYKVRIVWSAIFGTMALLLSRALLSFNLTVLLIIQVPLLIGFIRMLMGFVRLVQLDFDSFCSMLGNKFIYDKINDDYQNPIKNLREGFVGRTYFIKKNPQFKTTYEASDFCIKHDNISWAYYQTIQHHLFGLPIKKTKALQIFAYQGNITLMLRDKDDFDYADFLEDRGVAFILGYSKERDAHYEALGSKPEFIHTVVRSEQAMLQAESAGPVYNKPTQEVAIVSHQTFAEQLQAARAQVIGQFLRGKHRLTTRASQKLLETDHTEQLALDLETAAYQIVDEQANPLSNHQEGQLSLDTPEMKRKRSAARHEHVEQSMIDSATAQGTEEADRTVDAVGSGVDKQKQTTNGGNI